MGNNFGAESDDGRVWVRVRILVVRSGEKGIWLEVDVVTKSHTLKRIKNTYISTTTIYDTHAQKKMNIKIHVVNELIYDAFHALAHVFFA